MKKAKNYLMKLAILEDKLNHKVNELEVVRVKCEGISAVQYKDKIITSVKNTTEEMLVQYIDMQRRVEEERAKVINEKLHIIKLIESLSNVQHIRLLYLRHVENKKLEEIAKQLHYSYGYVRRSIGKAYEAFEEVLARENGDGK